jgi:competence protein ComEC
VRYPAAIPAVALVVGVAAGTFLGASPRGTLLAALAAGSTGALVPFARRGDHVRTLFLFLGVAALGWVLASSASAAALNTSLRRQFDAEKRRTHQRDVFAIVEGVLREDGAPRPWGASLNVQVDRIAFAGRQTTTAGGLRASVAGALVAERLDSWRSGRRVTFPVWLQQPSHYLDPGVADDEVRLAWRGVALVGSVKSATLVEGLARGTWFDECAAEVRRIVRGSVRQFVGRWDPRSAAIVTAILIGDRAGLDDLLEQRLQRAGTYHVMAISGGNIAILAVLTLWVLRRLRASDRLATGATIAILVAYACLVGPQPSVIRATLMALIYLGGRLLDERTNPLNALAVAVMVILCIWPLSIADAGFWLTFGATLAILLGAARFGRCMPRHAWLRPPAALLGASLCAEIALFPIAAFVFSRVTFAGLLLNFFAIPLMSLAQTAGMAAVVLSLVHAPLAAPPGWLAHAGAWGLAESATLIELAPWLAYRLPPASLGVIILYYLALGGWLLATTGRSQTIWPIGRVVGLRRFVGPVAIVAALWILIDPVSAATQALHLGRTLRVTFLDVGQGDSTLVQFPGGHSLLVDAGGGTDTFDLGGRIVSPTLWASRVRRLDTLEITHGDSDHIGGASSVFADFLPRDVWYGAPVPPHEPTRALQMQVASAGAVWRTLQVGDHLRVGGADVRVWHPPLPEWERQDVRNDDSVVVEIRFGGVSIVLPGDVSREIEHAIAPQFEPSSFRVLKAAHHGSATSSSAEFLDALRPTAVVFSCGRDNAFGHPASQVVRRFERLGTAIFRTDQDGAITLETDGTNVAMTTYRGRVLRWAIPQE